MPAGKCRSSNSGFSLVEVLAAVTIIGIIIYLAIPNIVQVRSDAEDNLAKSRADALNVAAAAFFQAAGPTTASNEWVTAGDDVARYDLLKPYIAFAQTNLASFMPEGYSITFYTNAPHRIKATLKRGTNEIPY
jgi:prepilin-type N-terminal cleavage/methylation domain-containing protein